MIKADTVQKAGMLGRAAAEKIEEKYEEFVQDWYDAGPVNSPGDPIYYDRQGDTFYGSSGYDKDAQYVLKMKSKAIGVKAGIKVSPKRLHKYYKDSVDYVFHRSFDIGIHGTLWTGGQTEAPKTMMDEWFKEFKKSGIRDLANSIFK